MTSDEVLRRINAELEDWERRDAARWRPDGGPDELAPTTADALHNLAAHFAALRDSWARDLGRGLAGIGEAFAPVRASLIIGAPQVPHPGVFLPYRAESALTAGDEPAGVGASGGLPPPRPTR